MLEMRPVCERCSAALSAGGLAFICSFECTFCAACTRAMGRCPNCGGELVPRPRRREKAGVSAGGGAAAAPSLVARDATAHDAAVIATIYNQGIADRVATFET